MRLKKKLMMENLSSKYVVRRLEHKDIDAILALCSKNRLYYEYCPPFVSRESIIEDMEALPPRKGQDDKYFLGYYENETLIAILDLISSYPDAHTAYIGFFMTESELQGKGVGSTIIEELCDYLVKNSFQRVELAWVKGNPQAERFWTKNGFQPIGERKSNAADHVIAAERKL